MEAILETPSKASPDSGDDNDDDILSRTFTNMKLDAVKRSSDRLTVEGSPICSYTKRMDLSDTPAPSRFLSDRLSGVEDSDVASSSIDSYERVILQQKVLVFSSSTDEHDTGNHQENALRTSLLCGEDGCLRRDPLRNNIQFVDTPSDNCKTVRFISFPVIYLAVNLPNLTI